MPSTPTAQHASPLASILTTSTPAENGASGIVVSFDDEHAAHDLASLVSEQRSSQGGFPGPCAVLQRGGGSGVGGAIVAESDVEKAAAAGADGVVIQAAAAREVPIRFGKARVVAGGWADRHICASLKSLTTNLRVVWQELGALVRAAHLAGMEAVVEVSPHLTRWKDVFLKDKAIIWSWVHACRSCAPHTFCG